MSFLQVYCQHGEFQQDEWQPPHPSGSSNEPTQHGIAFLLSEARQRSKQLDMTPKKLTLQHILSVRCPMCGAKPKEKCTLSTGHPSNKTHNARDLAAAKVSRPENSGLAALRVL